jgi:transcriptional regulator with XRE-family HTH domain
VSLPEQIKSARLRLGLTQAEAAAVCGVSARAYWQWEAGKSTLDVTLEGALERLRSAKKRTPRKGQNVEDTREANQTPKSKE